MTDREGIAITIAMGNAPQAVAMGLQKEYAERYDWIVKEFTNWAFTFMTSFLLYMDYDTIDEQMCGLYCQGNEFCSQKCKNQFNVYKSMKKKEGNKSDD